MNEKKKRFVKSLYHYSMGIDEMNNTVAAEEQDCGCACKYVNSGGSTVEANGSRNYDYGLWSPNATIKYFKYEFEGEIHIRIIE